MTNVRWTGYTFCELSKNAFEENYVQLLFHRFGWLQIDMWGEVWGVMKKPQNGAQTV